MAHDETSTEDLIGSSEAARFVGVSPRTIHRLVESGDLTPAMTAPGGPHGAHMFKRSDVERVRSHRESA